MKVVQNIHKFGRAVSWFHCQPVKLDLRMKKSFFCSYK